jgi:hypothetical protein
LEIVDKTLNDVLRGSKAFNENKAFEGKTILLGGDFRQILPIIPKGGRANIVHASLNYSYV